jgi:hypothetical protein
MHFEFAGAPDAGTPTGPQQTSVASLYGAPPVQPGGIAAPNGQAVAIAPEPDNSSLAMLFSQQQNDRKRRQADEQQAEQIRRSALFGGGPGGVAGLYG